MRVEEERGARRQQAARYEALAHVERQRHRHQPPDPEPDSIYRLRMGSGRTGSGRQGGLEGLGGEQSGQPSGGMRREGGRQNRAAQRQRDSAASGRESERVGASNLDTQAARCGAGVRDKKKAVRAGMVGTVRKGKERDKKGSRERDTGTRDSTE